ncbi:MAG: hypothetical protein QOF02_1089, partial [Blastocatellia bacterium]|nr:hypothetical protein [Blastocatellia bacterium]
FALHQALRCLLVVALLSTLLLSISAADAATARLGQKSQTTVRGKLVRSMKGMQRPAAYVMVTLLSPDNKQRTVPVYTDAKGMYYLYAPGGKYILEIWGTQKDVVRSFYIDVPNQPYFDVAPITIP